MDAVMLLAGGCRSVKKAAAACLELCIEEGE